MQNLIKASLELFVQAIRSVIAAELGFTDAKAGAARKQWVLDQLHGYIDALPEMKLFSFDLKEPLKNGLDRLIELALSVAKAKLGN